MSVFQSLAPRPPASLETVHDILGSLVALSPGGSTYYGAPDSRPRSQVSSHTGLGVKCLA